MLRVVMQSPVAAPRSFDGALMTDQKHGQGLDAAQRNDIVAIVSVGGSRQMAASYVGCHVETIRRAAIESPEFAKRLRQAELGPEILFLKNLHAAADDVKQWRAAAWALERMFPERYARRKPTTITQDELTMVLEEIAKIIQSEVPAKRHRRRILQRLISLTSGSQPTKDQVRDKRLRVERLDLRRNETTVDDVGAEPVEDAG